MWDCKARRTPLFETEFVETNLADVGIIWHWTDAANFWYLRVYRSSTADNIATVVRVVGGAQTTVLSVTLPGLALQGYARRLRLGVRITGTAFYPHVQGIALPRVAPSEVQTVAVTGSPTGGTFTLTLDGLTTTPIAYNAGPIAAQNAIRALSPDFGAATVAGPSGGPWVISAPKVVTASAGGLTGGSSPAITVTPLSAPTATSQRGVLISASDAASYVAAVRSFTEGRVAS
ncbi:hypothetical protein KG112_10970 [Nocardioides sp. zg-ZUI104]|nr:hypothetical protein [Nocardioides faecalis]